MHRLLSASLALPTWVRWASWLALLAAMIAAVTSRQLAWALVATAFAGLAGFATLPVLDFDGPLPFSSAGLHAHGTVVPWDEVVRVEPFQEGSRNLRAVVRHRDGEAALRLRVKGGRTWEDLRVALARYAPDKVAF